MNKFKFDKTPALVELPSTDGWIETVVDPFTVDNVEYYLAIEQKDDGHKFEAYIYDSISGTVMFEEDISKVYEEVYSQKLYDANTNRHLIQQRLTAFINRFIKWITDGSNEFGSDKIEKLKNATHDNVLKQYGKKPNRIGKLPVPPVALYPIGYLSRSFHMQGKLFAEIWNKTNKEEPTTMDRMFDVSMPAELPNGDSYRKNDVCAFVEVSLDTNILTGRYVVAEFLEVNSIKDDDKYVDVKMIWTHRHDEDAEGD